MRDIDREQLEGERSTELRPPDASRLEESIDGHRFQDEYLVLNQMNGVHSNVPQMMAMMPKRSAADFENLLSRLAGVAPWWPTTSNACGSGSQPVSLRRG